jgi:lipopolysaccharide biosynthesis glycosyltransferase
MKEAIITMSIGRDPNSQSCIESMKRYAEKYDKDFFAIVTPKIHRYNIYFEKYQYLELFKEYDCVLYLDSDVLITPQARNIFELYPDPDKFYAFDESSPTEWMNRNKWIEQMPVNFSWPMNRTGVRSYFNAGIQLVGKNCQSFISHILTEPFSVNSFYIDPSDQTALNYLCFKYAPLRFRPLHYTFNRMDLGEYDTQNLRYKADFIHYAGPCKYGNGNKLETIANDYKYLYEN